MSPPDASVSQVVRHRSTLLSGGRFAELAQLPIADPTTHTSALYLGLMYSRRFLDLDGHGWQVMWIDTAAEQDPEAFAASMQHADAPV